MTQILNAPALAGYEPEIGRWLWALGEVRRKMLDIVRDVDQRVIDWEGQDGQENAIGTLLYHIGLVEVSWLFLDMLLQDYPEDVKADFPHQMATDGRITPVLGVPLEEHLGRLARSRAVFLQNFQGMTSEDWDRLRSPADTGYQVSPAWIVFHLLEHEGAHAAQIASLKKRAARQFYE